MLCYHHPRNAGATTRVRPLYALLSSATTRLCWLLEARQCKLDTAMKEASENNDTLKQVCSI